VRAIRASCRARRRVEGDTLHARARSAGSHDHVVGAMADEMRSRSIGLTILPMGVRPEVGLEEDDARHVALCQRVRAVLDQLVTLGGEAGTHHDERDRHLTE
jgi:hypothetical protein